MIMLFIWQKGDYLGGPNLITSSLEAEFSWADSSRGSQRKSDYKKDLLLGCSMKIERATM